MWTKKYSARRVRCVWCVLVGDVGLYAISRPGVSIGGLKARSGLEFDSG